MNLHLAKLLASGGQLTDAEVLETIATALGLKEHVEALASILQFLHAKGYRSVKDLAADPVAMQFLGSLNSLRSNRPVAKIVYCDECGSPNYVNLE